MKSAASPLALALLLPSILPAQTAYYRHAVFDNSLQRDSYWNSSAVATAPSTLEQQNWRLPVDTKNFLSPPNALRLHWRSAPSGGWDAEIHLVSFRNRSPELVGHNLYFCVYAPETIAAADLPELVLSDAREGLQVATERRKDIVTNAAANCALVLQHDLVNELFLHIYPIALGKGSTYYAIELI